ncbi:AraC family transcriptional regulator [Dyella telluris]|uniref:Helix-turn-helix transcriptional regulator n=1 Tax=Dyella telluris TaxID=2763498 RepID=A0A7G8Q3K1_9GAMM|nr:AraC family transcriptional regulator [Dyella telluris]QNK01359.1 helix-turn-helix transcriptional regulator [Dyella telluris]
MPYWSHQIYDVPSHRGDRVIDSGVGLQLVRMSGSDLARHPLRYRGDMAILVVIPYDGCLTLRLGAEKTVCIDGDRSVWLLGLERGVVIDGSHDAAFIAMKVTLIALERLTLKRGVRFGGSSAPTRYPADCALESAIDALCEYAFSGNEDGKDNPVFSSAVGTAIQYHLLRGYGGMASQHNDAGGALAPWQLKLVKEWVLGHLGVKPNAATLARMCGISVSHFRRAFLVSTGTTLQRWIVQQRVKQVCRDLVGTCLTTADVAQRWGFSDQSHLTRSFAAVLGTTPARWRRAHLADATRLTTGSLISEPLAPHESASFTKVPMPFAWLHGRGPSPSRMAEAHELPFQLPGE